MKPTKSRRHNDLENLLIMIEHCSCKAALISDLLCAGRDGDLPELCLESIRGMDFILEDIKVDLDFVVQQITERKEKGVIVERQNRK